MNNRRYKKHLRFSVFVAILAIVWVATPDRIVKSQRATEAKPSPFEFKLPPVSKDAAPNIVSAPSLAGNLDPTFGVSGRLTIDFSSSERANGLAVQADGKIVAAGGVIGSSEHAHYDFAVFRYNADGSLDTSFDGDGRVSTPISNESNSYDIAYTVAIQTDGKIIAAGRSGSGNAATLVRYNPDGSLDSSFGAGGKVITVGYGAISEIAIQSDGKIAAASNSYGGFTVVRYNSNGSLDASFGTGGIVTTTFEGNTWSTNSVDIQPDGKIVAAGYAGMCDEENCFLDFALARYNTNGSPDTSFDTDGKLTTDFGSSEAAIGSAVQADGKIVAAGYFYDFSSNTYDYAVARYNGDGSLDASFDSDGKVTINFSGSNPTSVVVQSDGKIVVSGAAYAGTSYDFALLRLNTDGSLDTSFDADGKLTTDFGDGDFGADVAIQADGKILAAGYSGRYINGQGDVFDFALSRYDADGKLDAGFSGDGKVTTSHLVASSAVNAISAGGGFVGYSSNGVNDDFAFASAFTRRTIIPIGNSDDRANATATNPSGEIVAVGYTHNGSNNDFALYRRDVFTFGVNGRVTTDFGGNDVATAASVQADYKTLVVGHTSEGGAALVLARYNFNGSLDTSFGTGGSVIVQAIQNPKAMAVQPDGKIIAAGRAPHTVAPFGDNFALARFNSDGSLDTSFDGDGIAVIRFDFSSQINALALQPYGKIVAAGFTRNDTDTVSQFALARLNGDGSLDTSFDADGKVTTSFAAKSRANAVGVQRNGKIVAVGVNVHDVTGLDFALVRYNADGSLDTTFDTDGKQTTDFFGGDDEAFAAAIQPDGNIVAAGSAWLDGRTDFAAARYIGDAPRKVAYDFDGDGLAELSVFRPSNGAWYLNRSTQGFYATLWGTSTDRITPADYDGDGKTDIAVFRDGTWYVRPSFFSWGYTVQFGLPGDIPVPGDYIWGDGYAEIAVYRGGAWWTLNSRNNQVGVVQFGIASDKPVPADYDGDGRTDQAVYRGSGEWHINGSSQGYTVIRFGLPNDKPVPADYDGDGKADLAVFRDGTWYLLQSTNGFAAFQWGLSSDIPAPADYDGDGRTDAAVFRNGTWYLLQTTGGILIQQFGLAGDKPVPAAD